MLREECKRNGCAWVEPACLDTLLLAVSLLPGLGGASLDAVAGELGVSIHGRHTALGDSLVTAEVFASLLPRLADQGIATLGVATAFSRRAKGFVRAQAKAGW
jgi:DNA polymerase-3 subunit epsilon